MRGFGRILIGLAGWGDHDSVISGGQGAGNARTLMALLGQSRGEPPPEQISLW